VQREYEIAPRASRVVPSPSNDAVSATAPPALLNAIATRAGAETSPEFHAAALNRFAGSRASQSAPLLLRLQQTYGNSYVQRVLNLAGQKEGEVSPHVETAIERARGGGQSLDQSVRREMEPAFGADFSRVRVHTDSEAHSLNRAVNAVAFTTGQDIFFRQGEYQPHASSGKKLLAHELTHVVQQSENAIQPKLVLGEPNDPYEQQAERVSKTVLSRLEDEHAPTTGYPAASARVQRKCACGGSAGSEGECEECRNKHEGAVQRALRLQKQDDAAQSGATQSAGGGSSPAATGVATGGGCRRSLNVPCPGSLANAVEIPPPEGLGQITNLLNEGSCKLSVGGIDASGKVIEPHVFLDPGQGLNVFVVPPGSVKTVVACFTDCTGIGKLSYAYACA
jgi:hypothetical protein